MKSWARGEVACLKANLPPGLPEYEQGNGEGVWVLVDKATETLHDQDGTGTAPAFLANWPVTYPRMTWGDPVELELRGEKRAVVRLDSLQGPSERPAHLPDTQFLEHESPQWWPDAGAAGEPDVVRDFWRRLWGLPTDAWFFNFDRRLPAPPFRVLEFNPRPGLWCYATVGMSQKTMSDPQGEGRAELFALSNAEALEVVYRLANLATFPFAESNFLDWGHTITDDRGDILLVDVPQVEGENIELGEGNTARVLRILPLRPSELEFKRARGTDALRLKLHSGDADLLDWSRAPVV